MTHNRYTIRNLDPDLMLEIRLVAIQNRQTLGQIISEALHCYLDDLVEEEVG